MNKFETLYTICLSNKNVGELIKIIREDIRMSEKSIPRCAEMIRDIMRENIGRLSRPHKNREELKEIVTLLNKICVKEIIEIIVKKYPDQQINRRIQVSKEQMRRDLDVYGDRSNHVPERPYTRSRKEYQDDETFYSMRPNDIGYSGCDNNTGYASAFGNHMITNVPAGQKQPPYNNPHAQKDMSQFEMRMKEFMNERNFGMGNPMRPDTPDFTLDGSGDKVRREKMMRKMQSQGDGMNTGMNMGFGMNNNMMMNGMPQGMQGMQGMDTNNGSAWDQSSQCNMPLGGQGNNTSFLDDPYASLLAAGAPSQNMNLMYQRQGNPLMPMSSTNMMADQMGYGTMGEMCGGYGSSMGGQTVKSMQLQTDYEKN